MVHHHVHRVESRAAVGRGGSDEHDGLARRHDADAVPDEQPGKAEARGGLFGQRFHPSEGERFVMAEFERLHPVPAPDFAEEAGGPACIRVGCIECRQRLADRHPPVEHADIDR